MPPPPYLFVENRTLGRAGLALLGAFLLYYSIWVLALPFLEGPPWLVHLVRRAFPFPVSAALGVPAALGTALLGTLLARAYYLVLQDRRVEREELARAKAK